MEKIINSSVKELEPYLTRKLSYVGQVTDQHEFAKSFFSNNLFDPEEVESLILSYLGGKKLLECKNKKIGSSTIYKDDVYRCAAIIFDYYVKSGVRYYGALCIFFEKVYKNLEKYRRSSLYFNVSEKSLLCELAASILRHTNMRGFHRIKMVTRMCGIMYSEVNLHSKYNEFIVKNYCRVLLPNANEDQKKVMRSSMEIWRFEDKGL